MKDEYDFTNGKRGARLRIPAAKERITIRLDAYILEWFRRQVDAQGGGNYQSMINQFLRDYVSGQRVDLEETIRRVVREEFERHKTN